MAGPRVYYDLMSQPSRAVVLYLKLNNMPYIDNPLALRRGEHFTDAYEKINPFKLVPAIDDNGFILTESIAILKYLHAKYGGADHWYPADLEKRARVDEYLSWYHINTRRKAAMIFVTKVAMPKATQTEYDPDQLQHCEDELEHSLGELEKVFLKNKTFLTGDEITIADLMAFCEIMQPKACGYDVEKRHPNIAAWMSRVKNRIQVHFDEAFKPLSLIAKKFKGKL